MIKQSIMNDIENKIIPVFLGKEASGWWHSQQVMRDDANGQQIRECLEIIVKYDADIAKEMEDLAQAEKHDMEMFHQKQAKDLEAFKQVYEPKENLRNKIFRSGKLQERYEEKSIEFAAQQERELNIVLDQYQMSRATVRQHLEGQASRELKELIHEQNQQNIGAPAPLISAVENDQDPDPDPHPLDDPAIQAEYDKESLISDIVRYNNTYPDDPIQQNDLISGKEQAVEPEPEPSDTLASFKAAADKRLQARNQDRDPPEQDQDPGMDIDP